MASNVYPGYAVRVKFDLVIDSNVATLNDNAFASVYEALGIDYNPEGDPTGYKRPQDAQNPTSPYKFIALASTAAAFNEGGHVCKITDILDGDRIKMSKQASANASAVYVHFLKNEQMQSASIVTASGAVAMPKNQSGEVDPFMASDVSATTVIVSPTQVSYSSI